MATKKKPEPAEEPTPGFPIGNGTPTSPSYEEREQAELAKQREASEKLHRAIRLQQGGK